jgi:hypothetical protein
MVNFTKDHPFALVDEEEAPYLLLEGRFREAEAEELKKFYKGEK